MNAQKKKTKRNKYPRYDIVLPTDIAEMIDAKLGTEKKLDTLRVCVYLIFRFSVDGKLHEVSSAYLRSMIPTYKKYLGRLIWEGIVITDNKNIRVGPKAS